MSQSNSSAANRVVSLNSLGRDRSPGHRILGECRDQLVTGLCLWLRDVAAPISEELFVLADSTRERLQQTRYLDLRADIEKDWSHLVESFRRELSAQTEHCQNRGSAKENRADSGLDIPDFEGLQLLGDDDLSEHIVLREFAAQLSESCDEELYTLDRRVATLLGHDDLEQSTNPLAPPIICDALSDACATIGPDAEARLILMRRIERHLHLALPGVYQKINANLIERGILPDLKRNYRRNAAKTEQASGYGSAGPTIPTNAANPQSPMAQSTAQSSAPAAINEGILDALQRLAQARAVQMPAGIGFNQAGNTAGTTFQGAAADGTMINQLLLASLNELQHAAAGAHPATGDVIVNQVRMVRDSEDAKKVSGFEAVTIDVVAMLFDFIFDDAHVPVAVKALISRLQIPVLKVAMLNPSFFADRQHPTRRFLGSISGISLRWGDSVDESDPFYAKLADLVERIQAEFENDVEVFGTALAELESFLSENEAEEDDTALTAANIVMQRELESEAWERAQRAIKNFRAERILPAAIDVFIGEHWLGVLQASALNEDDSNAQWKSARAVMDDLAWSVEPKKSPAERLKLVGLLPNLLAQLNKGLDTIAANSESRKAFFDALVQYHSAALKGEAGASEVAPAPEIKQEEASFEPTQDGDLLVTRSIDQGVEVEEVMLVGASPIWRADDREIFRQVGELKRGDWVEFREIGDTEENSDECTRSTRERLNWISPQRGILLFSNHRSSKAISIAPEALARQIRDGKAEIIREAPLFERALSGALETMNAH